MRAVKLFFLLLLLIVPVILWFGLANLSSNLLKESSLYNQPLGVTHTWATRKLRSIKGADLSKENIVNFPITVSSITLNVVAKLNRAPKGEKEEKEIAGTVFWECSKGLHNEVMVKEMLRPAVGHERTIGIKEGGLTSTGETMNVILVFVISIIFLALYFPIIRRIVEFFKNQ